MRLTDLVDEYARRKLLSPRTRALHLICARLFSRSIIRHADVTDLTDANLTLHASRRLEKGKAAASVAGEQSKLLALWRFAIKEGYLATWPSVRPIRIPDRVPRAWTVVELALLFRCTEHARAVGDVEGPLWWRCLFFLLWDTGERIEAAMAIKWTDVDIAGRTILIPAEVRKGKTTDRLYPIAEDTANWLAMLPRTHRGPFFWPYSMSTLYNRFKRMLVLGGLPNDRRSKFHRIRRSTASHYKAAGGDPTELLGHSSPKITRGYLDPRIAKTPSAVDLLFRPEI